MINPPLRLKTFFLFLLAISSQVSATQKSYNELTPTIPCCFSQLFEVKAGYFFFSNSTMRKVYDKGGLDIQICTSYPLWNPTTRKSLNIYGAVEYFFSSGKSLNDHQKTSLWSIPINIGLKPIFAIHTNIQYYFAFGPRYFYIHQHNSSSYIYKNKSRNGVGFFVNTGFNYLFCNHFMLDIFGEYSYAKTHFHTKKPNVYTNNIQIGGFTFGGGLGYKF